MCLHVCGGEHVEGQISSFFLRHAIDTLTYLMFYTGSCCIIGSLFHIRYQELNRWKQKVSDSSLPLSTPPHTELAFSRGNTVTHLAG